MALQGYWVEPISYKTARPFVEANHYSKNTNGLKVSYCFGLFREGNFSLPELVGAIIYGKPAMNHQASRWNISNPEQCVELRRLCCIDETPKNTESFFISRTIKWLRKNTDIEMIVSYADPYYGHEGIVYKASNFKYEGLTSAGKRLLVDDKIYHDRTLRMKKPYAYAIKEKFARGEIELIDVPPKHIYTFRVK